MIYSRIFGGLGNQLFQYAAARAVSLRLGTELVLDARLAPPGSHWAFALDHFNINARIAEPSELPPAKDKPVNYALWRAFGRNPKFMREKGLGYQDRIANAPDGTYLHGYFQSERYFADVMDKLGDELRIITPPDTQNADYAERIANAGHTVSLHMRRGDYLGSPKSNATYATCDEAYYLRALERLSEGGRNLKVFVFSDDPVWVRDNLKLPYDMTAVGHNGPDKHYEDLRLMSCCSDHVIANSTFSWWGGWLDRRPDARVVGPAHWFNDPKLANRDILPDRWIAV
ncbi:glycosyl transferase family 11 [Litoreibacter halocynthiae]|uniref:Glycosyl transferase family 11 n=1 Tax=Litoreibacter halocynthiae TaxID=1242689 RepID=A0A4R7LKI2_9RHOB|nr:alpha-1,2-fucosyltransferase [Litoreibacter halocynthiae]TDT75172.1 glycosyl transferase family 11 [Litoreibacter halocynthiae]